MEFNNAYYIKLGVKGEWAADSFEKGIVRIGWHMVPIDKIINRQWDTVKEIIRGFYDSKGSKTGATQDFNALQRFCEASPDDVIITFHKGLMYWCNLANSPIEEDFSKFRRTTNGWSCKPHDNNNVILNSNQISGRISKTQAFQGTFCQYTKEETNIINRILFGLPNPMVAEIKKKKLEISSIITELVKDLHWKDCEILADLIFQQSGWHRISMHGGSMEFMDMEYLDPLNNERYMVQVKAKARLFDFKQYENFNNEAFKKMFFIVFQPDKSLMEYNNCRKDIEILYGDKLSELIFDLGLLNWVLKKTF